MAIKVNSNNFSDVIDLFKDFVEVSRSKNDMGGKAYLFPGHSERQVMDMEHPIFAQRSNGIFRSKNDKVANDYVRQLLMDSVAARLKCKTEDLPSIFKWAGELDNLKISDFGKGRPLTARRIDAILTATKNIEMKFAIETSGMKDAMNEGLAADHVASVKAFAKHSLPEKVFNKLPKFAAAAFTTQMKSYAARIDFTGNDNNITMAIEKEDESLTTGHSYSSKGVSDWLDEVNISTVPKSQRADYMEALIERRREDREDEKNEKIY